MTYVLYLLLAIAVVVVVVEALIVAGWRAAAQHTLTIDQPEPVEYQARHRLDSDDTARIDVRYWTADSSFVRPYTGGVR